MSDRASARSSGRMRIVCSSRKFIDTDGRCRCRCHRRSPRARARLSSRRPLAVATLDVISRPLIDVGGDRRRPNAHVFKATAREASGDERRRRAAASDSGGGERERRLTTLVAKNSH